MSDAKSTTIAPVSLQKRFPKEHNSWKAIRQRCFSPTAPSYRYVGGKGLGMCEAWEKSFAAFLEDMGPAPSAEHSIDRKDGTKGYYPDNCRWATKLEQAHNTAANRWLTCDGRTLCISEWARETGLAYATIINRIDRLGWSAEKALTTPANPTRAKRERLLTLDGQTMRLGQWAEVLGLPLTTLSWRLQNGWSIERALRTPMIKRGPV